MSAANYMAAWALGHDGDTVLEPSFGDGIFLRVIAHVAEDKGLSDLHVYGVEIDARARQAALSHGLIEPAHSPCRDFLGVEPFPVTAVIGNPPYVRLRHVDIDQRRRALTAAAHVLDAPLDPAGSLWMPFVLHSTRFLRPGGRMAFVLPYDFTYVRYARPLWQALRRRFGSLTVIRAHERLFPDLLQDVVILLADEFGESTDTVRFRAFDRLAALLDDRPLVDIDLGIDEIVSGERPFIEALFDRQLRQLLRGRLRDHTVPARELVTFNIGYVAGDKNCFHPDGAAIEHFGIPERSLRCAVTSARSIRGAGRRTSCLAGSQANLLFLPDPSLLMEGERRCIAAGEQAGVSRRYKCRIRDPWFVVPGVRVPDVVLSVFSERPTLLVNDADCVASNSLLCGYARTGSGDDIAAR